MIRRVEHSWRTVSAPDGRSLETLSVGPPDALPLLFHGGTPTAAIAFPPAVDVLDRFPVRFVTYSRPGYGGSDPHPGRSVADAAGDVAAILDALAAEEFVTIGWSGGGPHALACAALLADRCRAVATIAGVAPYPAAGLDWLAGMGEENRAEFGAAMVGAQPLSAYLEGAARGLADVTPDQVAAALGDLVSEVDVASLQGAYAEWLAATSRKSVSNGIAGWRDDDLAFVRPWGFELADIDRPVAVWQGDQDRMVPFAHGEWLADQLPTAHRHLLPDHGHLSLAVDAFEDIVRDLLELAEGRRG
jgi:pimeloyl-ACP methyl ester carboxylesterase